MYHHYRDITDLIAVDPTWWDEHAVPRYCEFGPDCSANIYSREVALVLIECQNCGTEFRVCFSGSDCSWGPEGFEWTPSALRKSVEAGTLHYGDPPNAGCCASGPTMNSVPRQVLEFWDSSDRVLDWQRVPDLEGAIDCRWAGR